MRIIKQAFQAEGFYEKLDKTIQHYEAKVTKSEATKQEDRQPEKIQGLSTEAHPPEEGKDLLGTENKEPVKKDVS